LQTRRLRQRTPFLRATLPYHRQENPESSKMTDFDSIKTQYRTLHRSHAFKKGVWNVYKSRSGVLIEQQGLPSVEGLERLVGGIQALSENRPLAIMQELAAEAV
jgi:hypothetical protein